MDLTSFTAAQIIWSPNTKLSESMTRIIRPCTTKLHQVESVRKRKAHQLYKKYMHVSVCQISVWHACFPCYWLIWGCVYEDKRVTHGWVTPAASQGPKDATWGCSGISRHVRMGKKIIKNWRMSLWLEQTHTHVLIKVQTQSHKHEVK